jgi:citrate synthase
MASALRLGRSALRTSLNASAFNTRTAAFSGLRCYSSAKTQVKLPPPDLFLSDGPNIFLQTLKERFAEQLPEKIEQIKKLRKYDSINTRSDACGC